MTMGPGNGAHATTHEPETHHMTISIRDNFSSNSASLGIATLTASRVRTNAVAQFNIDGRAFSKAVTDDNWTLAGTSLAANQICAFFLYHDAAGVATVEQSAIKAAATAAVGYEPGAFAWPDPATRAVVGAVLVRSGGAAFVPGTTSLAGVATYINMAFDYGESITY